MRRANFRPGRGTRTSPAGRPRPSPPRAAAFLLAALVGAGSQACGAGPEPPPSLEALPHWPAEELDAFEDLASVPLAGVVDLTRDDEGRLYLLDAEASIVRVLSPEGRPDTRIGGPGTAVGRFRGAARIEMEGERLRVWDPDLARVTWFDGRGRVAATAELPALELPDGDEYRAEAPLPGDEWIAAPGPSSRLRSARERFPLPVLRVDADGQVRDTLWLESYGETAWPILFEGGESFLEANPFEDSPLRVVDWEEGSLVEVRHEASPPARVVVTRRRLAAPPDPSGSAAGEGEASRAGPADETVWSELGFEPDPVSGEEVGDAVQFHVERLEDRVRGRSSAERRLAAREWLQVPEVRRPVQSVLVGDDGALWLRLTPTAREGGIGPVPAGRPGTPSGLRGGAAAGSRWVLLSPTGEPLARTTLPAGFAPLHARDRRLVGILARIDGEHRLVEVEVREPSGSAARGRDVRVARGSRAAPWDVAP